MTEDRRTTAAEADVNQNTENAERAEQTDEPTAEHPRGFLGGRLTPLGARALALAGFIALEGGPIISRHSVTGP